MKRNGFTLLELLIYIALISIISVVLSRMFLIVNSGRGRISSSIVVDSNLRFAVQKITDDIRSASAVSNPATAGESSASLILVSGVDTITYDVSPDGYLRRKLNSDQPENITENLVLVNTTNIPLVFSRLENNNPQFLPAKTGVSIKFRINMKYRSDSPDSQYEQTKESTVLLR